jgi:hypothetical protein
MVQDALYRKIIERLDEKLDPMTFQRCANALLMEIFPGLSPMLGGDDQGMDGAVADVAGDPTPIIATTDKNVLRNLRGSLASRIAAGSTNRSAVLATSQNLSNRRKRNLHDEAKQQGFHLISIYDQLWFSEKLYRNPMWRKELLGLIGNPPALSALPISGSSAAGDQLVGREEDQAAIMDLSGDRLLIGQPGSGKSCLLGKLALDGKVLFAISADRTALADALREHEAVPLVVVDDAQTPQQQKLLRTLLQIRNDLGAPFSLCAVSWPGAEASYVQDILGIADQQVLELGPLTIDQIVEILSELGLSGPRWLVADIVQQAQGWPGLATTLGSACLFGAWSEVITGHRLEETVLRHVERRSTERARSVLASFALGGKTGMPMALVASSCGITQLDLRQLLSELDASGVIRESGSNTCVVPRQLRCGLVRDTFYGGARSLDPSLLIANAPDICATASTLIGSASRGAAISPEELRRLAQRCNHDSVYEELAWLGEDEAEWVLKVASSKLLTFAEAGLHRAPRTYIPLLLQSAAGDNRELHATPSHPLRMIQDWIGETTPLSGEALIRRRLLLDAIMASASGGENASTCLRLLPTVLYPGFERKFMEVGSQLRYVHQFGYLQKEEISQLCDLWPDALRFIQSNSWTDWAPVLAALRSWARPLSMRGELPEQEKDLLQEQSRVMLVDLIPMAEERPAVAQELQEMADYLQMEVVIPIDREFATLYPERSLGNREDWREIDRREAECVSQLAQDLLTRGPESAMGRIAKAEEQALLTEKNWPRWTPYASSIMATETTNPLTWFEAAVAMKLPADIVAPFLHRAVDLESDGWADSAVRLLADPAYCGAVIGIALQHEEFPAPLLDQVLVNLNGYERIIALAILRDEVAVSLVSRLLRHERPEVSLAAAEGEWGRGQQGAVRDELRSEWEEAVVSHGRDEYWVGQALLSDSQLALRWIQSFLHGGESAWRVSEQFRAAVSGLTSSERIALLEGLSPSYRSDDAVDMLVEGDIEIYGALLLDRTLQPHHLVPLGRKPGPAWRAMILAALQHSYPPEDLARATLRLRSGMVWVGNEISMWREWVDAFSPYCDDSSRGICEVAEIGKGFASSQLNQALQEERHQDVHGFQ